MVKFVYVNLLDGKKNVGWKWKMVTEYQTRQKSSLESVEEFKASMVLPGKVTGTFTKGESFKPCQKLGLLLMHYFYFYKHDSKKGD